MDSETTPIAHPHLTRRFTAVVTGLICVAIWFMIYTSLWHSQVTQHWMHHLILLALGAASFTIPCLIVWILARGYDRARSFRGF